MDIENLDGYDALKQFVIDALRRRESEESRWVFSEEEKIDIAELRGTREIRQRFKSGSVTGDDQVLSILNGGVFDFQNEFDDNHSDTLYERDQDWFKNELSSALSHELADRIESLAEEHDLEVDEIEEHFKNDGVEFEEVFEGGLHHMTYAYQGSVPMEWQMGVDLTLKPSEKLISALAFLKIPPQAWLDAVLEDAENDPDNAHVYVDRDEEFSPESYTEGFHHVWSVASSRGTFFEVDDSRSLVLAKDLLHAMQYTWDETECELMLRFNLDDDHIRDVSSPLSRHMEGNERDCAGIWIKNAELVHDRNSEHSEGIALKNPILCRTSDLKLSSSDADDRSVAQTQLAGALGMNLIAYEKILDAMDTGIEKDNTLMDRIRGRVFEGPVRPYPDPMLKTLTDLFSSADGFHVERLAARYPGLKDCMPAANTKPSPEAMGLELMRLLGSAKSERQWDRTEQRERAWWLIQNGADLSLRHGNAQTGAMAIHMAAGAGQIDTLMLMKEHGADFSATFIPEKKSPDDRDAQVNLWEMIAKLMHNKRQFSGKEDISVFSNLLVDLEKMGVNPLIKRMLTLRDDIVSINDVIARADDDRLSQSHMARLRQSITHPQEFNATLQQGLYSGLRNDAFSWSKICMDAGARMDHPFMNANGEKGTVEELLEKHFRHYTSSSQDAFKQAKMYNAALGAREAIDDVMSRVLAPHL
jgi:hypothetical protein